MDDEENIYYISVNLDTFNFSFNPIYNANSKVSDNTNELSTINNELANDNNICRICLESSGNLISVCNCDGSLKYVHEKCILRWIKSFPSRHPNHNKCQICKSDYNFSIINLEQQLELYNDDDDDTIIFYDILVFGVILFFFIVIVAGILVMGFNL